MSSFHVPLTLLDPDGGWVNAPLHVHELHGRPVLLHFWSMKDARSCRDIAHVLDWMRQQGKDGMHVVGVHVPLSSDEKLDTNAIEAAARQLGLRHPIAVDDGSLAQAYGVEGIPGYLLFDADGWLQHRLCGAQAATEVDKVLSHIEDLRVHHGDGHLDSDPADSPRA